MAVGKVTGAMSFANIGAVPTHAALWDANDGTGNKHGETELVFDTPPAVNGTVDFGAGTIRLVIPNGDLEDISSDNAVDGVVAVTLYLALHSASPATHANLVAASGDDYKAVGAWTVSDN